MIFFDPEPYKKALQKKLTTTDYPCAHGKDAFIGDCEDCKNATFEIQKEPNIKVEGKAEIPEVLYGVAFDQIEKTAMPIHFVHVPCPQCEDRGWYSDGISALSCCCDIGKKRSGTYVEPVVTSTPICWKECDKQADKLTDLVNEIANNSSKILDEFCKKAYMAETGLMPSECHLIPTDWQRWTYYVEI